MLNFKVTLTTIKGLRRWIERIDARREQDVFDVVFHRYGFSVVVVAVQS